MDVDVEEMWSSIFLASVGRRFEYMSNEGRTIAFAAYLPSVKQISYDKEGEL